MKTNRPSAKTHVWKYVQRTNFIISLTFGTHEKLRETPPRLLVQEVAFKCCSVAFYGLRGVKE